MNFFKGAFIACLFTLVLGVIAFAAFAQTAPNASDVVDLACANKSEIVGYLDWAARAVGLASLIALGRSKIPAPIMSVIDAFALNWIKREEAPKA